MKKFQVVCFLYVVAIFLPILNCEILAFLTGCQYSKCLTCNQIKAQKIDFKKHFKNLKNLKNLFLQIFGNLG